jgi:hypothetical protein
VATVPATTVAVDDRELALLVVVDQSLRLSIYPVSVPVITQLACGVRLANRAQPLLPVTAV